MTDPGAAAFIASLEESQWLPPHRLQLYQRRLLDRLLRHARAETDFYGDRLAPVFRADDTIDWERWDEIPILTRAEAQANLDAMVARSAVPQAGPATERNTSGSTGRPFRHFRSPILTLAAACANERFYRWHDLDPKGLTAIIRATRDAGSAYPEGLRNRGWRLGHDDSDGITLSVIGATVDQQVEWLQRIGPRYLLSYPTNIREIGRVMSAGGGAIRLDAIMTYGEMMSRATREEIREHFGVEPLDRYGATEAGLITAECPHSHRHHVMAELVLVEVLDEAGGPCRPGSLGRVIVTPFYNHAMPLVRYDIEDLAVPATQPCGCGRGLPTLDAVVGRARDIFRFADGTRVWPEVRTGEIRRYVPHLQQQIVQVALDQIEVRYVPRSPDQVNDIQGLTAYLRSALHPSIHVTAVPVAAIPRSAGGKYDDFLSLVR